MRGLTGAAVVLVIAAACTGSGSGDAVTTPKPDPHVTTAGASTVVSGEAGLPTPIEVPAGWSYVTAAHSPHFAALVTATNPAALEDVRDGSRFGPVTGRGLEGDDAFVEIGITMPPHFDSRVAEPRFPRDLRPEHFEPAKRFLGRSSRVFEARGRDRIYYWIRFWIGPDADPDTAATALRLATSIRG